MFPPTSKAINDYLVSKNIYKIGDKDLHIDYPPNPKAIGDNMVGFLSQIGWIGDNPDVNTSAPRIQMEKIYIDVDTDGGNWLADGLHSKIPHRTCIVQKVCSYLNE